VAIGDHCGLIRRLRQRGLIGAAFDVSLQHVQQFDGTRVFQPVAYPLGAGVSKGVTQRPMLGIRKMVLIEEGVQFLIHKAKHRTVGDGMQQGA